LMLSTKLISGWFHRVKPCVFDKWFYCRVWVERLNHMRDPRVHFSQRVFTKLSQLINDDTVGPSF
jgi:hypothetical protein